MHYKLQQKNAKLQIKITIESKKHPDHKLAVKNCKLKSENRSQMHKKVSIKN